MTTRTTLIASAVLAAGLLSGAAHAAFEGRDLDGNLSTAEAYYDTDLDITWLADANHAKTSGYDADGAMTWANAVAWAANLSFTDGVVVYDNWRLPTVEPVNGVSFNDTWTYDGSTDRGYNVSALGTTYAGSTASELAYMFYVNLGNPGYYTLAGAVSGCHATSNYCLDNTGPFSNLQSNSYWSGSEYAPIPDNARLFSMVDGYQGATFKGIGYYTWAVSPGDVGVAAVPEAHTYALMLAGLGLVGWRARRARPVSQPW